MFDALIENQSSLNVDYKILSKFDNDLAAKVQYNPDDLIVAAEEAVQNLKPKILEQDAPIQIRIYNLPYTQETSLKNLYQEDMDQLYRIEGKFTQITFTGFLSKTQFWQCTRCMAIFKTATHKTAIKPPTVCQCGRRNFKLLENPKANELTDYQEASFRESCEQRQKSEKEDLKVHIEGDLVSQVVFNKKVILTGIARKKEKQMGRPKKTPFDYLELIHVQ